MIKTYESRTIQGDPITIFITDKPFSFGDVTPSPFPGTEGMIYYGFCFNNVDFFSFGYRTLKTIRQITNTVSTTPITGQGFYFKRIGTPSPDNKLYFGLATEAQSQYYNDPSKWTVSVCLSNDNFPVNSGNWAGYYFKPGYEKYIDNCRLMAYSANYVNPSNCFTMGGSPTYCYEGGNAQGYSEETGAWSTVGHDCNFYLLTYGPAHGEIQDITAIPEVIYHPGPNGGSTTLSVRGKNIGGTTATFRVGGKMLPNGEKICGQIVLGPNEGTTCIRTFTKLHDTQNPIGFIDRLENNNWVRDDYVFGIPPVTIYETRGKIISGNYNTGPFEPGQKQVELAELKLQNSGNYAGKIYAKLYYYDKDWQHLKTNTHSNVAVNGTVDSVLICDLPLNIPTGNVPFGVKVYGEDEAEPSFSLDLNKNLIFKGNIEDEVTW